jgi:hypothetical protein
VLDKIYNKTRYPVVCANIPLFSPFWNGGESTFYKMFDKPVIRGLMTYCWLSVFYEVYPTDERSRPDNDP